MMPNLFESDKKGKDLYTYHPNLIQNVNLLLLLI